MFKFQSQNKLSLFSDIGSKLHSLITFYFVDTTTYYIAASVRWTFCHMRGCAHLADQAHRDRVQRKPPDKVYRLLGPPRQDVQEGKGFRPHRPSTV